MCSDWSKWIFGGVGGGENSSGIFKSHYCALSFCELAHIIHSKDPYRTPTMPIRPPKNIVPLQVSAPKKRLESSKNCYKPAHKVTSCGSKLITVLLKRVLAWPNKLGAGEFGGRSDAMSYLSRLVLHHSWIDREALEETTLCWGPWQSNAVSKRLTSRADGTIV